MADKLLKMDDEDVKRAYARWAPVYDKTFGKVADAGRMAAVECINQFDGSVLEVGVGTGMSLPHYKTSLEITGIDLSVDMLDIARKRVKDQSLCHVAAIEEMDAGDMAIEDNAFETVVAMYVMTVVPDPVQVMKELARVCKVGGEVIVVNHFSQKHGLRGLAEKAMARFGDKLGWRPEFPVETILVCDDLQVIETVSLRPFGLFTMMRFKKIDLAKSNEAVEESDVGAAKGGLRVA